MKTRIFISVLLLIGLSGVAQRKDPGSGIPGFFLQKEPGVPSMPATIKSKFPGNTGQADFQKEDDFIFTTGDSYHSPSFDPTWAARFQFVTDSVLSYSGARGISVAVLVPGEGLLTCTNGISHSGFPITAGTRFGIMSNTKLFIAATLAELQDQGVLSLDDHLYQWLPSYPNIDSTTTIRQMLMHTSGFFDYWNDTVSPVFSMWADTSRLWTPEECLTYVGPPHFAPGQGYYYSNTNYLLAGMVIEAATGSTWVQKLHEVILDPLTLDSTFIGVFENKNGPVSAEWLGFNIPIIKSPMTAEFSQVNSAGAMLSTPQEMAGWYNSLFTGAAISDAALAQVTDFEPTTWYGLGVSLNTYDNQFAYAHGGASYGYNSCFWFDKQSQAILCLMCNDGFADFNSRLLPLLKVLYHDRPKKQHDAGITKIDAPWGNSCSGTRVPAVSMTNFGSAPLTSAVIRYKIDGDTPAAFNWTGSLGMGDTIQVVLPQINAGPGFHTFTCYTTLPNGLQEGQNYNDTTHSDFLVSAVPALLAEINEGFESGVFPPSGWADNCSSVRSWGRTSLASSNGAVSAVRNNYSDWNIGAKYDLDLPLIHIAGGTHPSLDFHYAYAMYPDYFGDSLQVFISTNCGATWQTLFNKGDLELGTSPPINGKFYPRESTEWRHESFSLSAYTGDVLIRFRSVCGWGNNLFLDDVKVSFPTGIADNKPNDNFTVYPNPTSGTVTVSGLPVNSEIQISDLAGKLILIQKTVNNPAAIDIGALPLGIYFLRSAGEVKKIVKL